MDSLSDEFFAVGQGTRIETARKPGARRLVLLVAALLLAMPPVSAWGQEVIDEGAQIARLIEQLGDPEFVAREEATQQLWRIGPEAEPLLLEALNSSDKEVVARASLVLDRFRYGIYAESPRDVVLLVEQYRTGDRRTRERVVQQLVVKKQIDVLERLFDLTTTDAARQELSNWALGQFDRTLVPLLTSGDTEIAKRLLLTAANSPDDIATCTSLLIVLGDLEEGIAFLQSRIDLAESRQPVEGLSRERRLLISLHRANADRNGALQLVEGVAGAEDVRRGLHIAFEDWQALSDWEFDRLDGIDLTGFGAGREEFEGLLFAAIAHHLASEEARRDALLDDIISIARQNDSLRLFAAECLFAVDRIDDAMMMLEGREPNDLFGLLCSQHRYDEAFASLGMELNHDSINAWFDDVLRPETLRAADGLIRIFEALNVVGQLALVGERDLAQAIYTRMGDLMLEGNPPNHNMLQDICRQEFLLGYDEIAWDQLDRLYQTQRFAVSDPLRSDFGRRSLFGSDLAISGFWWRMLSEETPDSLERLQVIRDLMRLYVDEQAGINTQIDMEAQERLDYAQRRIEQTPELHRYRDHLLFAEYCLAAGLKDMAMSHFESAHDLGDGTAALKLGDLAREAGDWRTAADWYEQAHQRNSTQAIGRYLQGHCLVELGDVEIGNRFVSEALLLSLPSPRANRLALALLARGFDDEAAQISRRVTQSAEPMNSYYSDAFGRLGNLLNESEPEEAARAWRQVYVGVMKQDRNFVNLAGYLNMTELIHHAEGLHAFNESRLDDAMFHIERCLQAEPANTQIAEDFVHRLEAQGRQEDADELFEELRQRYLAGLERFPTSSLHLNNLAWLCAKCDRRLDDALDYSEQAVALQPDSSNYLDTLAEISFLKGDVDRAIELARQCIELVPDKEHYHEQLARFQAALDQR